MTPTRVPVPGSPSYVVNVSRPEIPWSWGGVLTAPFELLALAWATPLLIFAITLPVGLAVALAVWIGRSLLR